MLEQGKSRWSGIARDLALVALFTVLSFFRMPVGARDSLFAEDGALFLGQWATDQAAGIPAIVTIFRPYAGYQHLVPRLGTWWASSLPVSDWALGSEIAFSATVAIIGVAIFHASKDLLHRPSLQLMAGSIPVLFPIAGAEALGNLANVHWYFTLPLVWLMFHRPPGPASVVGWSVFALVGALTETQVVLLAPLMLWGFRRAPELRLPVLAWGVGCLAQLVSFVSYGRPRNVGLPSGFGVIGGYLGNVIVGMFDAHEKHLQAITGVDMDNPTFILLPALGLLGAAITVTRWTIREARPSRQLVVAILTMWVGSVVYWSFASIYNNEEVRPFRPLRWGTAAGSLYWTLIPLLLSAWLPRRAASVRPVAIAWASIIAVYALNYVGSVPDRWGALPPWTQSVAMARETCLGANAPAAVDLRTQPDGWQITLPCSRLR